jgi:hypothetical protein
MRAQSGRIAPDGLSGEEAFGERSPKRLITANNNAALLPAGDNER